MVELLEAGTRARTCGIPGSELNGLVGAVVCYNVSSDRYIFELDESGDMMSLRKKNLTTTNAALNGHEA